MQSFETNPTNRAESFALFLKSQRQWAAKDLTKESISTFKSRMENFGYDLKHVLPHGSYLVNLGNPDKYVFYDVNHIGLT